MKSRIVLFSTILLSLIFCLFPISIITVAENQNDSHLTEISDIEQCTNFEEGFIYFGRPSCKFCQEFQSYVATASKETKQAIYYFNTDTWRDNPLFETILAEYSVKQVPLLVYRNHGITKQITIDPEKNSSQNFSRIMTFVCWYQPGSFIFFHFVLQFSIICIFILLFIAMGIKKKMHLTVTRTESLCYVMICLITVFISLLSSYYTGIYIDRCGLSGLNIFILPAVIFILGASCILIQFDYKSEGHIHEENTGNLNLNTVIEQSNSKCNRTDNSE